MLPFEIKTLEYNASPKDLQSGDEIHIEHVKGTHLNDFEVYSADGIVMENHGNCCSVKFNTKYGNEETSIFPNKNIFPKIKPGRVNCVLSYPKYNCVIVLFTNDNAHLIDLNNPGIVKYQFSTKLIKESGRKYMISPTHLLYIPVYYHDFGKGCILDMSNESGNVILNQSEETQNFVEKYNSSMQIAHVINNNHLYLTNGRRIIVYDISSGNELAAWNINLNKDDYCDPAIIALNPSKDQIRIFTNTKREIWELPTDFNRKPVIISIPKPQRQIYSEDDFYIHAANYDDIQINPRGELLVEISYSDEFKYVNIFSDKEIINLLEIVENTDIKRFANVINKLITTKFSEFRKKYPSLNIIFRHNDIKSIVLNTDFQSIMHGNVKVSVPRYVSKTDVFEHKLWINNYSGCLGGLRFEPSTGDIRRIDNSGTMYGDRLIRDIFPNGKYLKVTKEMVIKSVLSQAILKMVGEISSKIKYEDINGLPLSFSEFYTFDGNSFTSKDYSQIFLNNGEIVNTSEVTLNTSIIHTWKNISVKIPKSSDNVNISIDGNIIPDFGDSYPKGKFKSNYYIENVIMPYHKAIKLENIKGPGNPEPKLASEMGIIGYACNKFSENLRYEKQRVSFFVWKEDFVTIKVPLAFSQDEGIQTGHSFWCNNCYIIYNSEYVRFVRIKI